MHLQTHQKTINRRKHIPKPASAEVDAHKRVWDTDTFSTQDCGGGQVSRPNQTIVAQFGLASIVTYSNLLSNITNSQVSKSISLHHC